MSIVLLSLGCSMLILLILLARKVSARRLPRRVITLLWAVCALRMIIPFSLELPVLSPDETVVADEPAVIIYPAPADAADDIFLVAAYESDEIPAVGNGSIRDDAGTGAYSSRKSRKFPFKACLFGIWLCGAAGMFVFFGIDLAKSLKRVKGGAESVNPYVRDWLNHHKTLRRIRIRVCGNVGSPLTYGVLRPVIVITEAADRSVTETLNYILTHEYMHIRHFDSALKLLLAFALCIHWFNPLAWVMFRTAAKDIELACDEDVIRTLGTDERRGYAKTLILTEAGGNELLFSDLKTNTIEERIVAIMKYKRLSALSAAIAAVIAVTVALCAFTKPVAKENEEIVRTTARQKPNVTCEETYVRDSNDHMRRTYGYVMASSTDVVQYDDERSGTYVYPDYFASLNAEDYTELVPDEDGVCYLKISDARQFSYTGRVVITNDDGKPFKAIYNECDNASFTYCEHYELSDDDKDILGFVVDGKDVKRIESDSGLVCTTRIGDKETTVKRKGGYSVGLGKQFDSDTEFYIFLESKFPAYIDCISVSLMQGSFHGGLENGKYYIDGNQYFVEGAEAADYILRKHQLESAYNISLGNSVSLQTSNKLLAGLKAGQKVHVVTDIDLENTVVPEKRKWTDSETGEIYIDESGWEEPRWELTLFRKSDDGGSYEWVSGTMKRNLDVNVTFEIPEDGDYAVRLLNGSAGSLLDIISTDIEIIK